MSNPTPPPLPPRAVLPVEVLSYAGPDPKAGVRVARVGKDLMAFTPADLGPLCVKCGQAGDGRTLKETYRYSPTGSVLLIGVISLALSRRGEVSFSLCTAHRSRRQRYRVIVWSLLGVAFLMFAGALVTLTHLREWSVPRDMEPVVGIGALAGFVLLLVGLILNNYAGTFRAARIQDGMMKLKRAGPAYLATLPEVASPF